MSTKTIPTSTTVVLMTVTTSTNENSETDNGHSHHPSTQPMVEIIMTKHQQQQ